MNERVKDEQHAQRILPVTGSLSEHHHMNSYGIGVRIDPAHTLPPEAEARQVEWQNLEHFVPGRAAGRPAPAPVPVTPDVSHIDTQFLDDISQRARLIHNQIQAQKAVLDKREMELRSRLIELEEDQQRFHHQAAHDQSQLDARRSQLQKNEAALAERMIAFELHSRKLESEAATIQQQRADIENRKKAMREEILAELASDKKAIEVAKAELQKELHHARGLKDSLQERLTLLTAENQRTLKDEREKLWQSLTEEWEQRKVAFQQELDSWARTRDHEKSEIDRERAMFDATIASANAEFLNARDALAAELTELREQHANKLELEREEWQQARLREEAELAILIETQRAELLAERDAMTVEFDSLRAQQAAVLREEQSEWERTCEATRLQLAAEQEQHTAKLQQLSLEWEENCRIRETELTVQSEALQAERVKFEQELAETVTQQTAALVQDRAEWEQSRQKEIESLEAQRTEVAAWRDQIQHELRAAREHHDQSLQSERAEWEQTRLEQLTQLEAEKADWQHSTEAERAFRESQQAEWVASRDSALAASREALEVEFVTLRQQHAQQLQAERDNWEQQVAEQKAALQTRRDEQSRELTLIENRIRFQQDHLDKSRAEFEQAQNEHRRDRQIELQRLEEANKITLQRQRQVDLYRSSIDEREKSLDREQEVLSRTRKAITSTADYDRMNFQAEKHAWEQERQIQQSELRRQQEALVARTENLESRGIRLDKLRAELEETHRATLEMRLAVEESWAQLTDVAGEEEARLRVDQVRHSLAGYHQQMHESLSERRREHVESQSKFERQRAEFNDERQRLTSWLTKRDEDLRLGEERLRIAANEAAANHTKWLAARDRWLMEKSEAEQLIRRLLSSLGDNSRDATRQFDPNFRWDEVSALFNNAPTLQS
ncbi:coiled-coil domain-containing protein [Schlesneria paludicola]|uniref:hypothetical protein n=1 Tax=Schlesneria paludicola TaxID=360056 RepID=UPI00029AC918|nr:hypothetical protein [Schlesneria paludicola]